MKILVADDERDIRRLITFTLQRAGFEIVEAADGKEALEKATATHPDLIVLDVMMPNMDGHEVCRRLRAMPGLRDTPVLFLSAKAQTYEIVEGMNAGANEYFTKPFIPRELVSKVKKMVGLEN